MNGILRGTTPDFVIKVKEEDFLVTDVTKLEVRVYGRESRNSSYYMYAGTLIIVEA